MNLFRSKWILRLTVIYGFIVDHESAVGVLEGGVGGQDGVVRFNDGSGDLRSRVNGEIELGFLAVVNGQALHKQRGEARAGTTAKRVENQETLKTSALIGQLADAIEHDVDDFLANGVVTASIVVGGIFLASDELLRVEQLSVGSSANLIHYSGFQVNKDSSGNMLARSYDRTVM